MIYKIVTENQMMCANSDMFFQQPHIVAIGESLMLTVKNLNFSLAGAKTNIKQFGKVADSVINAEKHKAHTDQVVAEAHRIANWEV